MKKTILYITAFVIALFGLITLFLSLSIVFDWFDIRVKEGNYVLFVVLANLISSILYLLSAYGIVRFKKWATQVLGASVIILVAAFIGLLLHINAGGIYETKTIGAMIFRISLTLIFTVISYVYISKNNTNKN